VTGEFTPTCPLDEQHSCDTPLLLQGYPISYGSHIADSGTWRDTNFRINLDWTPTEDILMYFSVTTGYRAGGYSLGILDANVGFSEQDLLPQSYDSEAVTAFEIGYKGLHFDGTLSINAAVYFYDYEDYQDNVTVYDEGRQDTVNIVQNAPAAENIGFEIEGMWLPSDRITMGGNYSYTKTKYSEDYFLAVSYDQAHPGSLFGEASGISLPDGGCSVLAPEFQTPGCTALFVPLDPADPDFDPAEPDEGGRVIDTQYQGMFIVNAKGDQLKGIPQHKWTLWGSYLWPTNFGNISFWGSYSYTGDQYAEGYKFELDYIPDRFRADASVTWRSLNDNWSVRAFVNNLTDEQNVRQVANGGEGTNWRQTGSFLAPRFWGLDVRLRFGS